MRDVILPEPLSWQGLASGAHGRWLTTRDVARVLGLTTDGVRWLARMGRLAYEETCSGQRIFRRSEVLSVLEKRAKGRLRRRVELLAAIRPQMVRADLEPRQSRFRLARSAEVKKRKVT